MKVIFWVENDTKLYLGIFLYTTNNIFVDLFVKNASYFFD